MLQGRKAKKNLAPFLAPTLHIIIEELPWSECVSLEIHMLKS